MRRRTPLVVSLLPAILIAAYVGYWFMLARVVVADLADWAAFQRAQGYIVSYGEPARASGFPLAVQVELRQPAVTAPGARWRWQGPDTRLEVWPWAPFELLFAAPGHHRIDVAGDRPKQLTVDAPSVELEVDLRTDGPASGLRLTVQQAVAAGSRLAETRIAAASAVAQFPATPAADPSRSSLDLTLEASGVDLPADVEAPLGRRLDRLHVEAQVMGSIPPGLPHEAIPAWRDAGGDIEIRKGDLAWGPLALAAEGTLALDKGLQPEAAGTLHVAGLSEALDRLSAAGLVEERPVQLAKMMFGAFARPPAGGGPPEVQLPLTIQDGHLYAGPIKLARLHPFDWSWLP
jgi:hypothetical protein